MQIARNQNLSYRPVIGTISAENIFAKRWSSQARVCPAPSAQSDARRIFYAAIPKQWIKITRLSGASVSKYSTIITCCLNIRRNPRANLSCSNPLDQCKERKRLAFTASKCNGQSFEPRQVRSERSLDIDNWSWGIIAEFAETRTPLDNNFPPFVWCSDNPRQRKGDRGLSQGQWRYWRWVIVPIVTNDD